MSLGYSNYAELSLERNGDEIAASWTWRSGEAVWERLTTRPPDRPADPPQTGAAEWAEDLLWRSVSGIRDVEINVRMGGSITNPTLAVGSNVGRMVAQSIQRELGQEIERAESEIRARVDELIQEQVASAEVALEGLQRKLNEQIAPLSAEVTEIQGLKGLEFSSMILQYFEKIMVDIDKAFLSLRKLLVHPVLHLRSSLLSPAPPITIRSSLMRLALSSKRGRVPISTSLTPILSPSWASESPIARSFKSLALLF